MSRASRWRGWRSRNCWAGWRGGPCPNRREPRPDAADGPRRLGIDSGGGSTELVIGTGREMDYHVSNQAGVVRQTERHLHSDPPSSSERDALACDVREILSAGVPARWRHAVG